MSRERVEAGILDPIRKVLLAPDRIGTDGSGGALPELYARRIRLL